MTTEARAELLATIDALRARVESGDVETVALVVASRADGLTALFVGEDQECPVVHAMGLAMVARCCELVDEANDDDLPPLPDGPGDERAN